MNPTFQERLGYPSVREYTVRPKVPFEILCKENYWPVSHTKRLFGIELEIENTGHFRNDIGGWRRETDGSLRNEGSEYISGIVSYGVAAQILFNFFTINRINESNYSERCSTHIHADVRDFTVEQLTVLLVLYGVFEELLFGFAGSNRDRNIFCVPLKHTQLLKKSLSTDWVMGVIQRGERLWYKYTALNILPIATQGSVEFRHLPGTGDVRTILTWMSLIGALMDAAKTISFTEVVPLVTTLNSTSEYEAFMVYVLRDTANVLRQQPNYRKKMETGVTNAKILFMDADTNLFVDKEEVVPEPNPDSKVNTTPHLSDILNQIYLRRMEEEAPAMPPALTSWFDGRVTEMPTGPAQGTATEAIRDRRMPETTGPVPRTEPLHPLPRRRII